MLFSNLRSVSSVSIFIPNFQLPNPNFLIRLLPYSSSSSSTRLYSQFHEDNNKHNLVSSFNRLLHQKNPKPSIFQFGKILSSLVKINCCSTVVSLHRQMEFNGIASDLVILSILINCFSQMGQNPLSFSVFAKILKKGYDPNVITLTTLIKGLCLNGQIHQALHFHDKVVALGFHLDQVGYGTLINGLCKVGETRAALQLLRRVDGKLVQPNVVDKAIALLKKMKDEGIQPDMCTYTTLVDGLCKNGRLEDARIVFDDLLVKGYILDVNIYTAMIQGFCSHGLFDESLDMLSKMEENGCIPNAVTYEIIICSLFDKDENDKAEKLLREMIMRGLL